jgi:hypothetical protein
MPRRPSPSMLVALLALFLAVGGAQAVASGAAHISKLINGSQIKPSTITSKQVKDGSLVKKDFKAGELPAGAKGDPGPQGSPGALGAKGDQGDKGDTGSVDTTNFYTKTQADSNYLGKTAKAADTETFDGSDSSVFTRGVATSVGGNVEDFGPTGGSDGAFISITGIGDVGLTCANMGAITTIAYTNTHPSMVDSQYVAAVVTGGASTTASENSLFAGQSLTVINAENGSDATRHATISVAGPTDAVTIDLVIVNKPAGANGCHASGTYVRQGGIGTF